MYFIETRGITKQYAGHQALSGIDVQIKPQCMYGLLGPNGAGKTTFIRILNQIIAPDAGRVFFDGEPLQEKHIAQIGYMPEERGLYKKMLIGDMVLYLAQLKGMSRADAIKSAKHWFEKFEIQAWWKKKAEELSKGMGQKIQFITTVMHQPRLLILDEPFSGFDPINANLIREEMVQLHKNGATIIFSTHRMESVEEMCDYIGLINKSKMVLQGETKAIREQYKSYIYEVDFVGELAHLPSFVQQIEKRPGHCTVQLNKNTNPNELLKILIEQVEVHRFAEQIPSLNEIFIQTVQQTNA